MRTAFILVTLLLLATAAWLGYRDPDDLWPMTPAGLLIGLGLYDLIQTRHAIWRNYPVIGHLRWLMEGLRPYVQQYFIESDTGGVPINRMFRAIVYQRAKDTRDTLPYGTRVDTYRDGYEWMAHSLGAIEVTDVDSDLRVMIGGPQCRHPYRASVFNISALSFGALSPNAIRALNAGARLRGFAHNTGEGGISPYHLEGGGDLIWQLGTGYFGCRDRHGNFDPARFRDQAQLPAVKMIELKLSQGAKPGHGGILPAAKNTPEVARIRGVPPGIEVVSPAIHRTFDSPIGLLEFIARLRELADGKPVGFKLAVGEPHEFVAICQAMTVTGIYPDFVTVDGGEGGSGAAPLEYSNSVGMPLREALALVVDCLVGYGLKKRVRVIASGKILSAFHLIKHFALGADACNSGRGMMLALGCIHSLSCNTNRCPTGVATQNPALYRGLVVSDKARRVANYHAKTLHATADLLTSAGLRHPGELTRAHIYRRVDQSRIRRYDDIFPPVAEGCLLAGDIPPHLAQAVARARPDRFLPR